MSEHEVEEAESAAMFGGEIEVDESYFGGKRKGKRGRGAAGKVPVLGLLKRFEFMLRQNMNSKRP